MATLKDPERLRTLAAEIRDSNLAHLDQHLERLSDTWEAAGGKVFFASDADEAREYVVSLARKVGATEAVKSKSMVSEEIELNEALHKAGIEPIETDLGQYIVQLAGEPPSHILAPAVHLSKQEITDVFSNAAGESLPNDADALAAFAAGRATFTFPESGTRHIGSKLCRRRRRHVVSRHQ